MLNKNCCFLFFFILALFPCQAISETASTLRVPLGFCWGDSQLKLEQLAKGGDLEITQTDHLNPHSEKITVHGILGHALIQNQFLFHNDQLAEIEYQYGSSSWDQSHYQQFFENFRRLYSRKYGEGNLIVNINQEKKEGVLYSLKGYQWSQPEAILMLYYYSAEEGGRKYDRVSLHYQTPN